MKERPILFSAPMVRALLAGTKTQTRRVLGLPSLRPSTTPGYDWTWRGQAPIRSVAQQARHPRGCWQDVSHAELLDLCPYGAPGDRLWVRETHYRFGHWVPVTGKRERTRTGRQRWAFVADSDELRFDRPEGEVRGGRHHHDPSTPAWHVRLARFMPRWASRLTFEITSVRVECVQSISEEDARAEGVVLFAGIGADQTLPGTPSSII